MYSKSTSIFLNFSCAMIKINFSFLIVLKISQIISDELESIPEKISSSIKIFLLLSKQKDRNILFNSPPLIPENSMDDPIFSSFNINLSKRCFILRLVNTDLISSSLRYLI